MQWIARFNSFAYQVQAIRDRLLEGTLGTAGLIIIALTSVVCIAATVSVSRGMD